MNIGSSQSTFFKVVGIFLICLVLASFALIQTQHETYSEFNKRQVQGEVAALEPVKGVCKSAGDPIAVCKNYTTCCGETAVPGNCVCDNPIVKECRNNYQRCLDDQYLSSKTMDFIGLGNKPAACNAILDACCKIAGEDPDTEESLLKKVTMRIPDPDATVLCTMDSLAACKGNCAFRSDCQSVIMNTIEGKCELYNKPLVEKPKVYIASDSQFIQFEKVQPSANNKKEGFQPTSSTSVKASKLCRMYNTECSDGASVNSNCLCSNPIVLDCQRNYRACLQRPGGTNTICKPMFGACCSILDAMAENVELAQRFVMNDNPDRGRGSSQSLLCQPAGVKSLNECKQHCRLNPDCSFIDSNFAITANEDPNTARYCRLYTGKPIPISSPTLAPVNQFHTIYKKREVDPDNA